ncbi:MAG TPA: hypothetical protein VG366_02150 [Solirubrobacteraceae bacterium]|jgi:hypothetical protein|nr:hypothetical protein [Solirubrobacteraceae bacterium]
MPRIIVTTDSSQRPDSDSVLLDESVRSVHLSTGHAASQLVERLAWAISDAEDAESSRPRQRRTLDHATPAGRRASTHSYSGQTVRA